MVKIRREIKDDMTRGEMPENSRIWGLTAVEIHDAWWRGQGIQVVHHASNLSLDLDAEAFLLLPPNRLCTFELAQVASTLVWSRGDATRILVSEQDEDRYREEVVRDDQGDLLGISRSYDRLSETRLEAEFTTDRSAVIDWAKGRCATDSDDAEEQNPLLLLGHIYVTEQSDDLDRFLAWIVARWPDPQRVLEGVTEASPGIFTLGGESISSDLILVPPLWINDRKATEGHPLIVGPRVVCSNSPPQTVGGAVKIRLVREIENCGERRRQRLLPRRTFYGVVKRIFDACLAFTLLIVLSPVFLLAAIAILVDDGFPIFFGHVRQQRGGRDFRCWKFRTMRKNAEDMVLQLQEINKADGPQVFIENDPRVTAIGRFLRASQVDELPQFWNVLRGEMSFVGPRPSPDRENQYCPAWRELRLSVRPGITGLWQVSRTREPGEDFQEWIRYDVEYVRKASLWLDLKILFQTAIQIVLR